MVTARVSRLHAQPLREAASWLNGYQRFWDESHERLDELLTVLQADRKDAPERAARPRGRR